MNEPDEGQFRFEVDQAGSNVIAHAGGETASIEVPMTGKVNVTATWDGYAGTLTMTATPADEEDYKGKP